MNIDLIACSISDDPNIYNDLILDHTELIKTIFDNQTLLEARARVIRQDRSDESESARLDRRRDEAVDRGRTSEEAWAEFLGGKVTEPHGTQDKTGIDIVMPDGMLIQAKLSVGGTLHGLQQYISIRMLEFSRLQPGSELRKYVVGDPSRATVSSREILSALATSGIYILVDATPMNLHAITKARYTGMGDVLNSIFDKWPNSSDYIEYKNEHKLDHDNAIEQYVTYVGKQFKQWLNTKWCNSAIKMDKENENRIDDALRPAKNKLRRTIK